MMFALFTKLLTTCPFESSQPMVIQFLYTSIFRANFYHELWHFVINFMDIESHKIDFGNPEL